MGVQLLKITLKFKKYSTMLFIYFISRLKTYNVGVEQQC